MDFEYSSTIWPWSGFFAVKITIDKEAQDFDGFAKGKIVGF